MRNSRLAGHSLIDEGSPHTADGRRILRGNWTGTSGIGHAKCSCGALSDELDSGTKRRKWHQDHKASIRQGATDAVVHLPSLPADSAYTARLRELVERVNGFVYAGDRLEAIVKTLKVLRSDSDLARELLETR